jgi:Tol biopolymer transport system component/predicted Ser/Thr protein kinase
MPLAPGLTLGSYEILSALGEGGMGEVYLARDTRLGRKIALKILRGDLSADESATRRFSQEARAASALNHPNIVSIFDVGHQDDVDFIAMEYVEGRTLRAMLSDGNIEIRRAVDFAAQAAAGLAAAHEAHVVHRDIKPENLIVTRNGHLKILDFGLARLTEEHHTLLATQAATVTRATALTRDGTVLGTTSYMSPEQAQGREVDARTDIFSLGVVLYELVTGAKAFDGPSAIDVLHAIINTDPKPAVDVNPRLPIEIMEILAKALAKDPSDRYRHAGDFELDLRRFKRAFESGAFAARQGSRTPARVRATPWIAAAVLGIAVGGLGVWVLTHSPASLPLSSGLERARVTPLTTDPGFEGDPSLSPDGETLAYVSDRTGNFEIFLKQVSGGDDLDISRDAADDVQPSFAPDGRQIAFVSTRAGASELLYVAPLLPPSGGDIWVMPALGGNARRVAVSGNFPSWSPDGTELVFVSGPWFAPRLYRVSADGGERREVVLEFASSIRPGNLVYPRFSSDKRWIVFSSASDVYVVSANGGPVAAIARGQGAVWGPDSRSIIYSNGEAGTNRSLWSIAFDTAAGKAIGRQRPLTIGRGADLQPSISRDGQRIAFAATDVSTRIESQVFDADAGLLRGAPSALTDSRDQIYLFDLSSDGRSALFGLRRGPASTVWRAETDRPMVQLASDPQYDQSGPLWSPDGKTIAVSRRATQNPQAGVSLWTMASDGANPQRVLEKLGSELFTWTPDSRGIAYMRESRQLYLFDLASRSERRLADEPGVMPVIAMSPDGKWVVYQCVVGATVDLHAVSADGGTPRTVVASPAQDYHPLVSPSGRWVYYLPDHKNLYRVPGPAQNWRSAEPERITNFQATAISFIESPQLSRDGTRLAYSRGRVTSDIWLMTIPK